LSQASALEPLLNLSGAMKAAACFAVAFATLSLAAATSAEVKVTPVQKVITLMQGMLEKGKKSKDEEAVQFSAYKQWCGDTIAEKTDDVATGEEKIKQLQADIEKLGTDIEKLGEEITQLESDISGLKGDIKAATAVRRKENAEYLAMHKDYSESISAVERAIGVLKGEDHDTPQALLQLKALSQQTIVPEETRKQISAFLQQDPNQIEANLEAGLEAGPPEANAYEFQSGGIIEMLEKLQDEFMDERTKIEKEEMSAKSAFNVMVIDLKGEMAQNEQDLEEKKALKAKKGEEKAAKEAELQETIATLEEDKKFLADTKAECAQKASDFEDRQELRAGEIEALEKAIEIMSSDDVSGAAEKHLPSLIQVKATTLVQLRATSQTPEQIKASQFLRDQAERFHSHVLLAVAERCEDDPFKKVKRMIKELIVKLMEEAGAEAEHKAWCDTELATNAQTRKEKTAELETLYAEIDELEATIAQLSEEIKELTDAIAALNAAMAKATKLRLAEKEKNKATIADAISAQKAVENAMGVLKEFYANAAEATALVQAKPEIFDSPEQGQQAASTGVIGMLEVILSDFARLEAETKAAEKAAQEDYDKFMTDSEADKAAKNADMDFKTSSKTDAEKSLQTQTMDKADTQEELDAAIAYFDKLKPDCVSPGLSYEERVAQRKAEIQSLKEALQILGGETIA